MDPADPVSCEESPLGCNICYEPAIEPVIISCGHMFCWPCLYRWLDSLPTKACPVCRTRVITNVNIIPFYGMRDPPIPEQRINHANDLSCAAAIPSRPTAPRFVSSVEVIDQFQAQNPQLGAIERDFTEEEYQDAINILWSDLQFIEIGRHQDEEASYRLQTERNELWCETLQLRSELRSERRLNHILRDSRDMESWNLSNVVYERNRLLDEVRELRAANHAMHHRIMAMAGAPRHI